MTSTRAIVRRSYARTTAPGAWISPKRLRLERTSRALCQGFTGRATPFAAFDLVPQQVDDLAQVLNMLRDPCGDLERFSIRFGLNALRRAVREPKQFGELR